MTDKVPPHPGVLVRRDVIDDLGVTQGELARAMGISKVRLNQIINGRAPITAETALRLGHATDTRPEYWIQLQAEFQLFRCRERLRQSLAGLPRLQHRSGEP